MEKKITEEKEVHHGVQKVGGFPVHEKCTYCIFHETVADYIFLIPGQRICRYNTYGIEFTSFPLDNLFSKIMYVKFATVFLGWTPNRKHIFIYDEKFTELGVITSNFSLVNIIIDNSLLQMIFVGEKYISIHEMSSKGVFIEKRRFKIKFDKNICFDENKIEQSILVYFNVGEQELFCSFGRHGCIIDIKKENITSYKMCMHQFRISAIFFHPNFNWIVTGDEKGTIQSWDSTWTITMKIIGLKTAQFLSFDPTTNDIFVIGMNQMIIWNAAYKDKTQEIQFKKTVTSFTFNEFDNHLLTLSDKAIVWHNKTLCHLHCIQRAPATVLRSMHYPEWKWLTLVATADGTVQIINPDSGKQLTTLTGSYLKHRNLISYSCVLGTLYIVLCNQKQIIVSSCKSNPMEVKNKLKLPHDCLVTSMTVFEYLPRKESQKHIIVHSSAIILIILGMSDGNIVVLFPHLKIKQQMHVHGSPVLQLVALVNRNHLLSYEESNIIKLWKVAIVSKKYPLLPSMTFYYPNSVIHIAAIGATLCIVTENITRPNDILFMYNFETRTQWDHLQCDDHESKICSISSNEQLQLCATSSVDRTIRIWDKENHLLKILFLHAQPNLITFSLPRGDIIVSIGKHLYRINSKSYLPHKYEEMTQSLQMTEEHDKTSHDIMYLDEYQEDYNPSIANSLLQKLVTQKYKDPLIRQKINYYNSRNKDILDLVYGKQTSKVHSVVNRKHHFLYNKTTYVELLQHSDSTPIRKEQDLSPIDIKRLREKQKAKIMNIHNKFASLSERNITDLRSLYPASNYYIPDFNMFIPNSVAFKMMEPIINVFEIQASRGRSGKLEKINYENSFTRTFSDINETNTSSSLPIQPESTFVSYHMTEVHAETSISSNVRHKTTRNWETESIKNNSIIIHCLKNAQKEKEILTLNKTDKCLFHSPECITFPAEEKGFFNNTQELFEIGSLKDSLNLNGPDLPKTNQPKEASERKLHYNETNYHEAELESRSRIEIEERINYSQNELFNTLSDLWNNAEHDGDYNNILKILQKLGIVSEELLGENKKQILDFLLMESCKGNKEVTSILTLFASERDEDKIYVENEILQMLNNVTKNKTPFRNVPGTVKALKLTDVDVVAAMLVQYILSTRSTRKSIFEYFISIGLNDPDCVIKQYSIDWKNDLLKQCSKKKNSEIDYAIANKIVTKWLQFWMDSLEYHTNEILKLLLQDHELTCDVDRFLLDELERMINRKILQPTKSEHTSLIENTMDIDMPRNVTEMTVFIDTNSLRIVQGNVKPIEGLNYFCEVHNKQKTPLRRVSVKHTQTCFADIQKISEEKLNSNLKAHKPWKVFLHKPLPAVQVGNSDPYPVPSLLTLRTSQKYFWPDSSIAKMQDLAIFNDILRIE